MRRLFSVLLIFLALLLPVTGRAQGSESSGTESQVSKAPAGSRAQRREARKQWKMERKKKHSSEKAIKNYKKRTQTKETRKRMKETRRKAELTNEHKREFFLRRWFKGKLKTTKKKDR
jgi:hypothetical protein